MGVGLHIFVDRSDSETVKTGMSACAPPPPPPPQEKSADSGFESHLNCRLQMISAVDW